MPGSCLVPGPHVCGLALEPCTRCARAPGTPASLPAAWRALVLSIRRRGASCVGGPGTPQTGRLAPLLYQPGSRLHSKPSCRGGDSVSSAFLHPSTQAFCKFRSVLNIYPESAVFSPAVLLGVRVATSRLGHGSSLLAGGLLPPVSPLPHAAHKAGEGRITSLSTSSQSS